MIWRFQPILVSWTARGTGTNNTKKLAQLRDAVRLRNRQFFTNTYLKPMTDAGLIEMTIPERPNSSQQAYCLSEKGYVAVA